MYIHCCCICTVALEYAWSFVITTECLQLMIEKNTNPTLPHPVPSLTSNAVTTTISSGAQQTTSSHTAVTETTPVEETNTSQQNGTV